MEYNVVWYDDVMIIHTVADLTAFLQQQNPDLPVWYVDEDDVGHNYTRIMWADTGPLPRVDVEDAVRLGLGR